MKPTGLPAGSLAVIDRHWVGNAPNASRKALGSKTSRLHVNPSLRANHSAIVALDGFRRQIHHVPWTAAGRQP